MAVPEKIDKSKELNHKETLEKEEAAKLARLSEGAEKAGEKRDKDIDAIFRIEAELKPEAQKDELETLQAHLIVLVADLKKVGADVNILKGNPKSLENLIGTYHPKLNEEKEAARGKLGNLLMDEGPTSSYVKSSQFWIEIVGKTTPLLENPMGNLGEAIRQNKVAVGISIGVALGIGMFLGKKLFSKKSESAPAAASESKGWSAGKIALTAGVGALAIYLGKDKAMELLGGLMKDKTLETLGLDRETIKEIENAAKQGTALSEETRELLSKSEQGREVLSKIETSEQEKEAEKPSENSDEAKGNVEKITLSEAAQAHRYLITAQALMGLYELDSGSNEKLSQEMTAAFDAFSHHDIKTLKVIEAYQKAKSSGKTEIRAEALGLEKNSDVSPEGLYHAAVIINKAYEYHQKRFPDTINVETTVKEFLIILGNDPALSVANSVQKSMEERLKDLNITSPADLFANAEKIFESEAIDGAINENKEHFITHLTGKYRIDISDLDVAEKLSFFKTIGILYSGLEGDLKLDSGADRIRIAVKQRSESEIVTKKVIQFWEKLKEQTQPIFEKSILRYDIKHADDKYDRILEKNLKFKNLDFKDGLQLALLSDGINFEEKTEGEGMGQTKEISMTFLMASLLKKHHPNAHTIYMGNLINLAREDSIDFNLNPRFAAIAPYFKKLFGKLIEKSAGMLKKWDQIITIQETLGGDPERLAKIREMPFVDYVWQTTTSGAVEAYRIPRDLVLTVYETFNDLDNTQDDAKTLFDKILGAGGIIFYSKRGGENVGYVYWAGKYFLIEPIGAAIDGLEGAFKGEPWVGAKAYLVGVAPFMVLGAVNGLRQGQSVLAGLGKGLTAPVSIPVAGYRAARGIGRHGEIMKNWAKYGSGNTANLEMSSRLFLEYNSKTPSKSGGFGDKVFAAATSKENAVNQAKKWLYKDLYSKARLKWGINFSKSYNNFFGLNVELGSNGGISPLDIKEYSDIDSSLVEKARRMKEITQKISANKGLSGMQEGPFFEAMKEILNQPHEFDTFESQKTAEGYKFENLRNKVLSVTGVKAKNLPGIEKPILQSPTDKLTTPEKLRNGKYRYMGEEFSLNATEQNLVDMKQTPEAQATELKNILSEKWANPDLVSKGPAGDLYRYRGGTFVISDAELSTHKGSLEAAMEAKYTQSIQITDTRMFEGVQEYKIGNQWIRPATGRDAELRARQSYAEAIKNAGLNLEHMDLSNTKLLKYWPVLKQMMGPVMAIGVISHLGTASDKKKALVETGVGLTAFIATERGTRHALDKLITSKNPSAFIGKEVTALLVGLGAAIGVTQPISEVFEEMIPQFTGDQQIFVETASFFEKLGISHLTLNALTQLEKKKTMEFLGKKGLGSLAKVLTTKVEGSVGKKVHKFATQEFVKKVGSRMGLRGAILAGTLADDATVIGVLDDVVAVGMAAWMAKDVYDILVLTNKSIKINAAMEKFNQRPIKSIEPVDEAAEKSIETALAVDGKTVDDLETMNDEEKMKLIQSIPDIRIKITREGSSGSEEYRFVKGEVYSTTIVTDAGEILELSDEELNQNIALPPPQEFDPSKVKINYEAPPEQLKANYRMAILFTKSECGWTKLDHEIVDDKTIILKRLDGTQQTKITRSGDKWSVEGYSEGNDLFQALVLANLKNKVQGTMEKEGYTGGSSRPFSIDGGNIDFDKSWNPNDLRVLSEDTGWLAFYDKIGLNQRIIVDMLNNWYQKEGKSLAIAA